MGKLSKRKKFIYFIPTNKKQRLDTIIGSVGYLATCNRHEDVCVKEGYSLLNCFADKLYGPEQIAGSEAPEADEVLDAEVSDTEEDADAALQKEVARLQTASQSVNQKGNAVQRRFQSIRCGAANNVFFRTTLADPLPTLLAAMDDILQTKLARTKHLIRLLPVHAVCKAYLDKIEKALAALCTEKFDGSQKSFYAVIKVMSNSAVKKEEVLSVVLKVMKENAPQCKPVLTKDAEVALVVSIIVTNCYIGIAPSYLGVYKKYNLNELAAPASADVPGNTSINDPVQKGTSDKVVEPEGCVEGAEDSAHAGNKSEKANAEKDDSKTVADE